MYEWIVDIMQCDKRGKRTLQQVSALFDDVNRVLAVFCRSIPQLLMQVEEKDLSVSKVQGKETNERHEFV